MSGSHRRLELDVLRCAAVVLVLFRHLQPLPESVPALMRVPFALLFEAGWVGVDLFFVLSGFLVAGLMFREVQEHGRIDLKRFLVRRGFKIYPGFYCLIAATVGIAIVQGWNLPWKRILSELFFVQNYFPGLWNQTWSLGVEEHFYLLLPLVLISLVRLNRGKADPFSALPRLYLVVAILLLGLRLWSGWRASFQFTDVGTFCYRHLTPTHLRIDSLLLGVVLSYWHHFHARELYRRVAQWRVVLAIVAILGFAPTLFLPLMQTPWMYTVGFLSVALGAASLLLLVLQNGCGHGLAARALGYVGAHSYSIYLWHAAVGMLADLILRRHFGLPLWIHHLACLTGSIVVGIVMAKLIELPVLRVRDRFFPSRSRALAESEPSQSKPASVTLDPA